MSEDLFGGKDIQMDVSNLWREEMYTDLKTGSIRKLVPVKADGSPDEGRDAAFLASTQVMTPAGALPLSGEIEGAKTLDEAVAGFSTAVRKALEDLRTEMAALQRERASQIVVPGRDVQSPPDLLIH